MCVDVHIHLLYQLLDILYIIMLYFHRSIQETEALRDEALKKRWRERSVKFHALEKAEVEEQKRKKEGKMLRLSELTQTRESERAI